MSHVRISTSGKDKSAVLWSIKKRSITVIGDDTFGQITADFTAIRGEVRLPICSRQLVAEIFQGKDDAKAVEALQKHLPGFEPQVIAMIYLNNRSMVIIQ